MKKFFCDKCEKEITIPMEDGHILPMITGAFLIKNKHHNSKIRIWVDWECLDDNTVEHICKNCLFSELKKMNYLDKIVFEDGIDEDLDDEMEKCEYKDEQFFEEEKEVPYKQLKCTSKKRS